MTSLTLSDYAKGCLGSLVPTSVWVCGTASTSSAASAAAGVRRENIEINILTLGILTTVSYKAYMRYRHQSARQLDWQAGPLGRQISVL
mmetsp:Transcript_65674/g.143148  ORF Transcript_65674/g.143148 Transcript_65674/m.143148 type:complete len:89 (-) Transcript_65674:47-313(-)